MLIYIDLSHFGICPIVSANHVRECHWMTVPSGLAAILFQCSRPEPTAKSSGPRQRRPKTRFVSEKRSYSDDIQNSNSTIMCRLGICDSRFLCIRVQICVFLPTVGVSSSYVLYFCCLGCPHEGAAGMQEGELGWLTGLALS